MRLSGDGHAITRASLPGVRRRQPLLRDQGSADQVPAGRIARTSSTTSTSAGRTKIVVRGQISDYIPNPTFEVVARPGAQEEYFRHGNPEGKTYREIMGEPMKAIPAFREPAARLEVMDELGLDYVADVPDAGQPGRGADEGRPRTDPRRHPRPERVDVRDLAVQLRRPDLLDPGHHPADRRQGDRGARVVPRARRQDRPGPAGSGARVCAAPARSARRSSTRSGRRA